MKLNPRQREECYLEVVGLGPSGDRDALREGHCTLLAVLLTSWHLCNVLFAATARAEQIPLDRPLLHRWQSGPTVSTCMEQHELPVQAWHWRGGWHFGCCPQSMLTVRPGW